MRTQNQSVVETAPKTTESCFCGGPDDDRMVACDVDSCKTWNKWYHYDCVGFDVSQPTWECQNCREETASQPVTADVPICFCNNSGTKSQIIGCAGDNCLIQWFHFSCVKLKKKPKAD